MQKRKRIKLIESITLSKIREYTNVDMEMCSKIRKAYMEQINEPKRKQKNLRYLEDKVNDIANRISLNDYGKECCTKVIKYFELKLDCIQEHKPGKLKEKVNKWIEKKYKYLKKIDNNCYFNNILYFYRVHVYQGALEALLSFYLLQVWLIFTPLLSDNAIGGGIVNGIMNGNENRIEYNVAFLLFVGRTITISLIIFMIYIITIINMFTRSIIDNIDYIDKNLENNALRIKKRFVRTSLKVHTVGVISYTITGFMIGIFFCLSTNQPFISKTTFIILLIGFCCGTLWNIQDYFADNRLNCWAIYKELKDITEVEKEKLKSDSFKNTLIHGFLSLLFLVVVMIAVLGFVKVAYLNKDSIQVGLFMEGGIFHNAYILLFLAILILYIKTVFDLYYKIKSKKSNIDKNDNYPTIEDVFGGFI